MLRNVYIQQKAADFHSFGDEINQKLDECKAVF